MGHEGLKAHTIGKAEIGHKGPKKRQVVYASCGRKGEASEVM